MKYLKRIDRAGAECWSREKWMHVLRETAGSINDFFDFFFFFFILLCIWRRRLKRRRSRRRRKRPVEPENRKKQQIIGNKNVAKIWEAGERWLWSDGWSWFGLLPNMANQTMVQTEVTVNVHTRSDGGVKAGHLTHLWNGATTNQLHSNLLAQNHRVNKLMHY